PVVSALSLPLLADLLPYRVRPDLLLGVLMTFADVITALNDVVWALPLVILCLLAGVYFTLRTRFVQVTGIPDMLKQLVVGEKSADGTSSFQSLMMSLANRVGMGNIGGVPPRSPSAGLVRCSGCG